MATHHAGTQADSQRADEKEQKLQRAHECKDINVRSVMQCKLCNINFDFGSIHQQPCNLNVDFGGFGPKRCNGFGFSSLLHFFSRVFVFRLDVLFHLVFFVCRDFVFHKKKNARESITYVTDSRFFGDVTDSKSLKFIGFYRHCQNVTDSEK